MSARRLTTERALALLLKHRQAESLAKGTVAREQAALRRLLPALGKPLSRVTRQDVEALLASRLEVARPATVLIDLASLRQLFGALVQAGELERDPTQGLSVRVGEQRQLHLSREEVRRLLDEASRAPKARRSQGVCRALALRNRAALELLYGLGLRAGEACGLRVLDLDLAEQCAYVRRVKGCAHGVVPLPPALVPHLERYVSEARPTLLAPSGKSPPELLVNERGNRLSVTHLERLVASIGTRAGVEVHPHAFRRSLATHLVQEGASLVAVQQLLGHRSLDTTQRYVSLDIEDLRASVEALPLA